MDRKSTIYESVGTIVINDKSKNNKDKVNQDRINYS
jgi:hypothetical protein